MHRFFDDADDMAQHIKLAEENILPLLETLDGDGEKFKTALFILFTRRAIKENGLTKERAHAIIDTLFDQLSGEVVTLKT
jgi:site-specific recombinase